MRLKQYQNQRKAKKLKTTDINKSKTRLKNRKIKTKHNRQDDTNLQ